MNHLSFTSQSVFRPNITQIPDDGKEILHSRLLKGMEINFYINQKGELLAESLQNEESIVLEINIPVEWKNNLFERGRIEIIKKALEESFFYMRSHRISIYPRGLGGWGDEVHKGYVPTKYSSDDSTYTARIARACAFTQETFDPSHNYISTDLEGTYFWALKIGLDHLSPLTRKWVAFNTCHVDYHPNTRPTKFWDKDAQAWHFNCSDFPEGSLDDTRIVLALDCLQKAINFKLHNDFKQSLELLGRGLHPLQDVFSHRDVFVKKWKAGGITCCEHISSEYRRKADDPYFIDTDVSSKSKYHENVGGKPLNVRYSDTKTATYVYLLLYRLYTEPGFACSGQYDSVMEKLKIVERISKISHPNFRIIKLSLRLNEIMRQTYKIYSPDYDLSSTEPKAFRFLGTAMADTYEILILEIKNLKSKLDEKIYAKEKKHLDSILYLFSFYPKLNIALLSTNYNFRVANHKTDIIKIRNFLNEISLVSAYWPLQIQFDSILKLFSQYEKMLDQIKEAPTPVDLPKPQLSILILKIVSFIIVVGLFSQIYLQMFDSQAKGLDQNT